MKRLLLSYSAIVMIGCTGMSSVDENDAQGVKQPQTVPVQLGMPFAGKWAPMESEPGHHDRFTPGTHWATDLGARKDTPLVFWTDNTHAAARIEWIDTTHDKKGCVAGHTLYARILIDKKETNMFFSFGHIQLSSIPAAGTVISQGGQLGKVDYDSTWLNTTCYQVKSQEGTHTHMEASGCYKDHGDDDPELKLGTVLGDLGGTSGGEC